jgi:hypothetical protein
LFEIRTNAFCFDRHVHRIVAGLDLTCVDTNFISMSAKRLVESMKGGLFVMLFGNGAEL